MKSKLTRPFLYICLFLVTCIFVGTQSGQHQSISYAASTTSGSADLALWLKFDETTGLIATDSSGNDNTGTLNNMEETDWLKGKIGNGVALTAANEYIVIANSPALTIGTVNRNYSVAFWYRLDEGASGFRRSIMQKGNELDPQSFFLWMQPDENRIEYSISPSTSPATAIKSDQLLEPGEWTHIAFVKSKTRIFLYINGLLDSSQVLDGESAANNSPLYIGQSPWYSAAKAVVDDLRIYHHALTQSEVGQLATVETLRSNHSPMLIGPGSATDNIGSSINRLVTATDLDGDPLTFRASDLPPGLTISSTTGVISGVPNQLGTYMTTYTVEDTKGSNVTVSYPWTINAAGIGTGSIMREWWTDIIGGNIIDLMADVRYPNEPTGTAPMTSFEEPLDQMNLFGSRVRGYLHAPLTGTYHFWIASDDEGSLRLSANDNPANAIEIGYVPTFTANKAWTTFGEQASRPISLIGGQKYYIESLRKEAGGFDNHAVAWQLPGGSLEVIPGDYLSPFPTDFSSETAILSQPISRTNLLRESVAISLFVTAPDLSSVTFDATDLPGGIAIHPSNGTLSGTLTEAGNYTPTIRLVDASNRQTTLSFAWIVSPEGNGMLGQNCGLEGNIRSLNALQPRQISVVNKLGNDVELFWLNYSGVRVSYGLIAAGTTKNQNTYDTHPWVIVNSATGACVWLITDPRIESTVILEIPNRAPTIASIPNQQSLTGDTVSLVTNASDEDNDVLIYTSDSLPLGLNISASSGLISGIIGQAGNYNVTVTVDDGEERASTSFSWVVTDPNLPPSISNPSNQVGMVGAVVSLQIETTDDGRSALSFSAANLPIGLTINAENGLITGILAEAGQYRPTITVDDGETDVSTSFDWLVVDAPTPTLIPTLTPTSVSSTPNPGVTSTPTPTVDSPSPEVTATPMPTANPPEGTSVPTPTPDSSLPNETSTPISETPTSTPPTAEPVTSPTATVTPTPTVVPEAIADLEVTQQYLLFSDVDENGRLSRGDIILVETKLTNHGKEDFVNLVVDQWREVYVSLVPGSIWITSGTPIQGEQPESAMLPVNIPRLEAGQAATVAGQYIIDIATPADRMSLTMRAIIRDESGRGTPSNEISLPIGLGEATGTGGLNGLLFLPLIAQ